MYRPALLSIILNKLCSSVARGRLVLLNGDVETHSRGPQRLKPSLTTSRLARILMISHFLIHQLFSPLSCHYEYYPHRSCSFVPYYCFQLSASTQMNIIVAFALLRQRDGVMMGVNLPRRGQN